MDMRLFCRTAALAAVAAWPLGQTAAAQTETATFGDWSVSCDQELYCIARTSAYGAGETAKFKLERSNRRAGKLYVTTGPHLPLELGMRVDIDILGLDEGYGVYGDVRKVYKGNEMTFPETLPSKLADKLREGNLGRLTVDFGGSVGPVSYTASLVGVTEALLYMDQAQGRVGNSDAIVAWGGLDPDGTNPLDGTAAAGSKNAEAKAVPTKFPVSAPAAGEGTGGADVVDGFSPAGPTPWANHVYDEGGLPASVAELARNRFDCEFPGAVEAFGASIVAIGGGEAFYTVPCFTGDVNIESFVALVKDSDPANPTVLEFELPPAFNADNRTLVINPSLDPDTLTISVVGYSSPEADCGTYESHSYDREYGYLELREYREKHNCDGQMTAPENYPLVWTIAEMGD